MRHASPLGLAVLTWGLVLAGRAFAAEPALTVDKLAKENFKGRAFTAAETILFAAVEAGQEAAMAKENDPGADPATQASWPEDRTLNADVLSWLCTNPLAAARLTHHGIRLRGMKVKGKLDLSYAKLSVPLMAESCVFTDEIDLTDARLRAFILGCCFLRSVDASRAHIEGDMTLQNGCRVEGNVLLYDTTIDGSLNLESAELRHGLGAARAKIGSSVYLKNGFRSDGEVHFGGATIGGDFDCENSSFINPNGNALTGGGMKITRALLFRENIAEGEVNFPATEIGANLDCSGSILNHPGQVAFDLDGGHVHGQTFLRDGFVAFGEVRIIGATIDGNFECDGAQIYNPGAVALQGDSATIGGNVYLRPGSDREPFTANGAVDFLGSTIAGSLECDSARLTNPNPRASALTAERAKIGGNVFLRKHFRADGAIKFMGAQIAKSLIWTDVEHTPNTRILLPTAQIGSLWVDATICPKSAAVEINHLTYYTLELDGLVYDRIFDDPTRPKLDAIEWLKLQTAAGFHPQPYEQLATVLRTMGREEDARDIMIAKNARRRDFPTPRIASWLWYHVVGPRIDYGYAPRYAFMWSVVLIAVGAVLFWAGYRADIMAPTKPGALANYGGTPDPQGSTRQRFSPNYPRFNAFIFSLESFTPLLRLDQSSNWAPNAHRGWAGRFLRIYLWCHIIAGWILTSLWVGSVTGLVKT